jgi:hypothetical protein
MSNGEAAQNPGDDGATPPRRDERPRPQYGEYAPEGWTWQPPAGERTSDPAPQMATPAARAPAAGAAGAAGRPVDRIITVVLLALAVLGALNSVLSLQQLAPQVQLVYDQQGIGDFTPPAWLPTLALIGTIAQLALLAVTLVWSVRRLRAGRLAFWVPIAGGAASVIVMMVLVSIVFLNDPTFLSYLDGLTAAP